MGRTGTEAPPAPTARGREGCVGRPPRVCPPEPHEIDDEACSLDLPFAAEVECSFPPPERVFPDPENELGYMRVSKALSWVNK